MNVLIVDDETLAREHLSQLLGSLEGYSLREPAAAAGCVSLHVI